MNKKSAFTLTELLVTMSAGSTLMMLAIGMIHQTMTLTSISRQRVHNDLNMNRLAEQFRHDVHLAKQVTVESPQSIRLTLVIGDDVSYETREGHVLREQLVSDQTHRETYYLTPGIEAAFTSQNEPLRALLTVSRETALHGVAPRIDRHVSAVVGRLQRHVPEEVTSP